MNSSATAFKDRLKPHPMVDNMIRSLVKREGGLRFRAVGDRAESPLVQYLTVAMAIESGEELYYLLSDLVQLARFLEQDKNSIGAVTEISVMIEQLLPRVQELALLDCDGVARSTAVLLDRVKSHVAQKNNMLQPKQGTDGAFSSSTSGVKT